MSRVKSILNPKNPAGWYVMPHILVLLALVAVSLFAGFGAGWGARGATVHDQAFWLNRYHHSLKVTTIPPRGQTVKAPQGSATLPPTGSVDLVRFPGIADQGPVGQCQAVAAAEQVTFAYRKLHPKSWANFSWKFLYEQYGHGADQGSYLEGDLATVPTVGVPRLKQYPTPPFLPLNWPEPALDAYGHDLAADAAKNRFTVVINTGANYPGAGRGIVDWIREQIAQNNAVNIDFPVYAGYFDNTPYVMKPTAGQTSYGGHANVVIGYDDNYQFPDGEVGALRIQNQWGTSFKDHGRAWMSYDFVAENAWGIETVDIQAMKAGRPALTVKGTRQKPLTGKRPYVPPAGPTHKAPPVSGAPAAKQGGWKVGNAVPYASLINAAGNYYKVWPQGIASLIGVESNFDANAFRYTSYADHSCGLAQETIPTARGEGVLGTDDQICNWLFVPANSIWLTARMLAEFRAISCVRFAALYSAWNEGPYLGCGSSLYPYPQNVITIQALSNFHDWLAWVRSKS